MSFIRKGLLSAEPEGINGAGYAREKAGVVEEGGAVVFTGGDLDPLRLEFAEIGC